MLYLSGFLLIKRIETTTKQMDISNVISKERKKKKKLFV